MIPMMGRNLLQSINLLTTSTTAFAEKCIDGIEPNLSRLDEYAQSNVQVTTALNEIIGYEKGTAIVKAATASGRPIREVALEQGVEKSVLDKALDLRKIARGNKTR
jgi:fumarate hydratase class II